MNIKFYTNRKLKNKNKRYTFLISLSRKNIFFSTDLMILSLFSDKVLRRTGFDFLGAVQLIGRTLIEWQKSSGWYSVLTCVVGDMNCFLYSRNAFVSESICRRPLWSRRRKKIILYTDFGQSVKSQRLSGTPIVCPDSTTRFQNKKLIYTVITNFSTKAKTSLIIYQ